MFERLRTALAPWLTWFSTLPLPARFLIGATVSAIGSAGAVGAVTKLGAYWFVLYYGVRTPADGIPYVAETAAALSVLMLVSAALVYLVAYLLLSVLKLGTSARAGDPDFIHTLGHLYIWCMRIGAVLVLLNIVYVLSAFPWSEFANRLGHKAALYGLIFLLGNLSISFGVWKGAAVFALLTVFSSFALWIPPAYGWFLRTIGHGGGRYCTVYLADSPFPEKVKGYLIVRTGTALLMFDGKDQTVEIPQGRIQKIEQPTAVHWCLPGNCTLKKPADPP